jgi:hypothetical protein
MQRGPGQPWDGATGAIAVQTHHAPVRTGRSALFGGWEAHRATGGRFTTDAAGATPAPVKRLVCNAGGFDTRSAAGTAPSRPAHSTPPRRDH